MKSIERKADGEFIGGWLGDAGSKLRVDPHFSSGAEVKKCAVAFAGAVQLAR